MRSDVMSVGHQARSDTLRAAGFGHRAGRSGIRWPVEKLSIRGANSVEKLCGRFEQRASANCLIEIIVRGADARGLDEARHLLRAVFIYETNVVDLPIFRIRTIAESFTISASRLAPADIRVVHVLHPSLRRDTSAGHQMLVHRPR